jgi:NAD(P)-dependent dehydrogenase (short-subunit alcohol dehydrogenase family)
MSLTNKVVVVLGGGGLLGSEFVRACASEGARVVSADIKEPKEPLALPKGTTFIRCDATNEEDLKTLAQKVQAEFGRADAVINAIYPSNTKVMQNKGFESGDIDDMLHNMSLHLRTCFLAVRAFVPLLKKQKSGSIVFLASIYGVTAPRFELYEGLPMTQPAEYAAAKGGIIAVARYFASLLGKDGVRVNTISPGGIAGNYPQSFVDAYSKRLLLGKGLLDPKHIAGAVVFLASDASEMMTGQNLVIDGGWTL